MSPMAQLYLRNAKKVECASAFPPTAISVTVKISKIVPKDSAVLIYTPPLADRSIRFNGPETVADVLLLGMKCIRKLFSAAVISSWIF
jgi:hypothetical protein